MTLGVLARIAAMIGACAASVCETLLTFCTNFRGLEAIAAARAAGTAATLLDSAALTFEELSA